MYQNEQYPFNPFAQNVAIVKNYFKRGAMLTQAILYIIAVVASLALSVFMSVAFSDIFASLYSDPAMFADMPSEMQPFFEQLLGTQPTFSVNLTSLILPALIATASFIIYFKSKNDDPMSNPMPGFTLWYVVAIINLVSVCAASLLLLLFIFLFVVLLVAMGSDPSMASDMPFITGFFVGMMVMFALLIALVLTYGISNVRYIKSVRDSLCSVTLSSKGAGAYGTCNIIYAVVSGFSILMMIGFWALFALLGDIVPEFADLEALAPIYLIGAVTSVFQLVTYIVEAVIAKGYKKYIDNITTGYGDVATVQPMYTPDTYVAEMPAGNNTMQSACCPHCGAAASDNDIFCNACGFKIR